ncbi:hypothetical protein BS78_K228000 [Paspalum vaginatum]|uniref:Protein kinase domain-containing protein n=1 Tax=Paspalum vaginatum TaxID=158149 RepID=A0A9W8CCY6_9POAL|nr:hypothetical protein BS78_K228000 [Paspalum vaginatum]
MMCFQAIVKLPQACLAVPYWCTIILLICSLLSSSQAKSCKCPCSGSDQEPRNTYTLNTTFDQLHGDLFLANSTSPSSSYVSSYTTLGSYKRLHHSSNFNLSQPGLFIVDDGQGISLWETFSVVFTMSIYQQPEINNTYGSSNSLIFSILPDYIVFTNESMATQFNCTTDDGSDPIIEGLLAGRVVTIYAGEFYQMLLNGTVICVQIDIESLTAPKLGRTNYSVSIKYEPLSRNMEVQVSVIEDGQQSSGSKTLNFSDISSPLGLFSISSSMGQLFQLYTWNTSVEWPSDSKEGKKWPTAIILSSVLGSAAAAVAMAVAVYCYFNSKYRGWKKELDQLAKSMQRLPGVPTQFSFSDIQRATNNFHEATKLGRGGFGTVYKCSLPARNRKKGEVLEVAVKKFSRDDNRRYEDFLAEVSVINRLRHKNIVPLVGWSYNKGEPLLIYEYMPNGSLDQHLFRRSGGKEHQQPDLINQLGTRYNMVKDIATGLHYVHHEYEPMVLHRDIKTSNIMVDSNFQGRLGDFGLACVVAKGKNSYTDIGPRGTPGFMSPEYILSGKATSKSDVFAFGVLILEIITGKLAVDAQFRHITDWVWHLHKDGRLLNAVDSQLTTEEFDPDDAKRLLLLGLACSHPNPSDRPNMVEAVQIITKSAAPPDVPLEKPRFVWVPKEGHLLSSDYNTELSSLNRSSTSGIEMTSGGLDSSENGGNSLHYRPTAGPSHELFSIYTAE